MFIPPISGDDAVVYWVCQAILNPGPILQLDPLRTPDAAGARKDPRASASRVSRQATLGQSGLESTDRRHEGSCHSSNQDFFLATNLATAPALDWQLLEETISNLDS
jgi:hypothetical protein